ncbi:hypothetical protein MZTS_01065 [Methylorubrum zatmanii]|uniref:Uncharacterized protein n=1 Tax=Methylorubrum extorquens (strain ATCC 14718 / DSM 1338 / JCM 2805 / NCIMB 9133 / AM1) TaxID=272630 RepID=C5B3J0_METEA|nr:Hypothetical protein MexAM1_META2p0092 [Methylorubrum extorquens AM1]MBD8905338.1 hypothetical protein [Methylorubrum zatmanii]
MSRRRSYTAPATGPSRSRGGSSLGVVGSGTLRTTDRWVGAAGLGRPSPRPAARGLRSYPHGGAAATFSQLAAMALFNIAAVWTLWRARQSRDTLRAS